MTRRKKMTVRKLRDLATELMDQYPNDSEEWFVRGGVLGLIEQPSSCIAREFEPQHCTAPLGTSPSLAELLLSVVLFLRARPGSSLNWLGFRGAN
jgi:hypothetical protein